MEPFFPGFLSDRLLDRNFVVRNVDKKKANGIYFFLFLRYLCFCARFLNHSAAVIMLCALYFIFLSPSEKRVGGEQSPRFFRLVWRRIYIFSGREWDGE